MAIVKKEDAVLAVPSDLRGGLQVEGVEAGSKLGRMSLYRGTSQEQAKYGEGKFRRGDFIDVMEERKLASSKIVPIFAAGEVLLPHPERAEYPDGRRGAEWVRGGVNDLTPDAAEGRYEHPLLSFPKGAHDDDVDATTQYLNHAAGDFASRMINAFKGR